jgi:hypothetical protein
MSDPKWWWSRTRRDAWKRSQQNQVAGTASATGDYDPLNPANILSPINLLNPANPLNPFSPPHTHANDSGAGSSSPAETHSHDSGVSSTSHDSGGGHSSSDGGGHSY